MDTSASAGSMGLRHDERNCGSPQSTCASSSGLVRFSLHRPLNEKTANRANPWGGFARFDDCNGDAAGRNRA